MIDMIFEMFVSSLKVLDFISLTLCQADDAPVSHPKKLAETG